MDTNSTERRPIPGYDGQFEIDTDGNVYAMVAFRQYPAGRLLKSRVNPDGYITVTLQYNGRGMVRTIHRLLMLTFRPIENSDEMEVNHKDLNKANNDLMNLEWLTHDENLKHAGKVKAWASNVYRGENISWSKLTERDVREIHRLARSGMTRKAIAQQFGVSPTNITLIVHGKIWSHIKP